MMRVPLPVLGLLLAATMWGLLWYPLRLLEGAGLPGLWVIFVAYAAALAAGLIYLRTRRVPLGARRGLLLALVLAAGWCNVSFMVAVLEGTVVRVVLLFYLSPLWSVLLGRVILGERMGRSGGVVLALAVAGAALMLWDPALGLPWPQDGADWLALSSGLAFSVTNLLVRALQDVVVPVKTVASWVGGVVIAGAWLLLSGAAVPEAATGAWFGAAAMGLAGLTIMTLAVQYGVTNMPLHRSAVILLFELVVVAVSTQLLTDEVMSVREWSGGVLIVAAALVAAWGHAVER
jgi:drug/metabolite transporter (DMT)-like permease